MHSLNRNKISYDKTEIFEKFYNETKRWVYSFLLNILNYNKDDAEQILSDCFVKLREYMWEKEIKNMKWLIYTIAHNLAVNYIKKNNKTTILDEDMWNYNNVLEEANFNFEQEKLQKAIAEFDPATREVIHLTYYEEKSYEEIWVILWIPKNTVWTLLFQAKNKLKRLHLSF